MRGDNRIIGLQQQRNINQYQSNILRNKSNSLQTKVKIKNNSIQKYNNCNNQKGKIVQNTKYQVDNTVNSQDSTHPQPNNLTLSPISQTKITKTHKNLLQIPMPYRPQLIQQLYLSHNSIKSVKNKLRNFINLRNLNLSYNYLTNVKEFISQIVGNQTQNNQQNDKNLNKLKVQQNSIIQNEQSKGMISDNLIKLKMLCIRMNSFSYGYQDQIVQAIDTLQKFQDFQFINKYIRGSKQNKFRNNNKLQTPQQLFYLANRLSQYFIPAYLNINKGISILTNLYQQLCQSSSNRLAHKITNILKQKYQKITTKLSNLIEPQKQVKYMPCSRIQALQKVMKFIMIGLDIEINADNDLVMNTNNRFNQQQFSNNNNQINYMKQKINIFQQIVRQILIKFSMRNNYQLIKTLKQSEYSQKQSNTNNNQLYSINADNIKALADKFGSLFNARRHTIYQPNCAKYIQKINTKQTKQHPFLQYLNYDNNKNNINTTNNNTNNNMNMNNSISFNDQFIPLFDRSDQYQHQHNTNNQNSNFNNSIEQLKINRDQLGNLNTLDGNRRRCKNTIIRNLQQYENMQQQQQQYTNSNNNSNKNTSINLYQKLPIIIFQPNYLDILHLVISDKSRQFIKIYDIIQHNLRQSNIIKQDSLQNIQYNSYNSNNQQKINNIPKFVNHQKQINFRKYQQLDSSAYLCQQLQQQSKQNKRKQIKYQVKNNKKQTQNYYKLTINNKNKYKQNELEKDISGSDSLDKLNSNKQQQKISQNKRKTKNKQSIEKQLMRQRKMKHNSISANIKTLPNQNDQIQNKNNEQYRKTLVKNQRYQKQTKQNNQNKQKKQRNHSYSFNEQFNQHRQKQQTKYKNKRNLNQQNIQNFKQNLNRYSMYEINLAYKVLTALKKHKNKSKRKKAKKLTLQNKMQPI